MSGKNKTKLLDQSVFDISSFHRACGNEILFLFCLPANTLSDSVRFGQGSVTRFGKISPLWLNFTSLWKHFDGFFLILQNIKPILVNLLHC